MGKYCLTNAVNMSKEICTKKINTGDIVIDATCGNGNDTIFLAGLVGDSGRVYAFDVQETALNHTMENLKKHNLNNRVYLINDSHEKMDKYIKEKVKLIIFNLGYLPGGDHTITTKADTTIAALEKSLDLLEQYGIVLIVVYHGHEEGKKEKAALEDYLSSLDQKKYTAAKFSFMNQINNPPFLIIIEKR